MKWMFASRASRMGGPRCVTCGVQGDGHGHWPQWQIRGGHGATEETLQSALLEAVPGASMQGLAGNFNKG